MTIRKPGSHERIRNKDGLNPSCIPPSPSMKGEVGEGEKG